MVIMIIFFLSFLNAQMQMQLLAFNTALHAQVLHSLQEIVAEGIKSFISKVQTFLLVQSKSYKVLQKGSLTFILEDLIVQKN